MVDSLLEYASSLPSDGINGAGLFIICPKTKKVLLGRRTGVDQYAGTWCTFGGGVEPGEHPLNTAIREVGEEAGIAPDSVNPSNMPIYDDDNNGGYIFRTYLATCDDEIDVNTNHEHDTHGWYRMTDLPQPLHPGINRLLANPAAIRIILDALNH